MVLIIRFCLWYGMISASDIKVIWYHSPMISPISRISRHLRGELVLAGGATGQELSLLLPRRRKGQQTGDGCPAERQRTWSRAWTCCSGCCASSASESAGSCSSSSSCLCNLNFKFKLPVQVASATWISSSSWSTTLAVGMESEPY